MFESMSIVDLAKRAMESKEKAEDAEAFDPCGNTILIYGKPKSGKTFLAATAAKAKSVKRVFWIDGENGFRTVQRMWKDEKLTTEEMSKIIRIRIEDTRDSPKFFVTMRDILFSDNHPIYINQSTGKVYSSKSEATKYYNAGEPVMEFQYSKLDYTSDVIVIDSGSALTESGLAKIAGSRKPEFDDWGALGKSLSDQMSVIQQASHASFILCTHPQLVEEGTKNTTHIYPLLGTRNFSMNVGKFFSTIAYIQTIGKKRRVFTGDLVSPTFESGCRDGYKLESMDEASLAPIFDGDESIINSCSVEDLEEQLGEEIASKEADKEAITSSIKEVITPTEKAKEEPKRGSLHERLKRLR